MLRGNDVSSAVGRIARRLANAWRAAAERRAVSAACTVLHVGHRRGGGVRYRAWFADPARFDRLVAPVASFAWSVEASAEALRFPGKDAYFELGPLTVAEVDEFRRRFRPTRDETVSPARRTE